MNDWQVERADEPEDRRVGRLDVGIAQRPPDDQRTFGYRRFEILALGRAIVSDVLLNHVRADRDGVFARLNDDRLAGLTIINAFFENSTRTLLSFEIAGKRLGAILADAPGERRQMPVVFAIDRVLTPVPPPRR